MEAASSHSSSDDINNYSIGELSKDLGRSSLNDISITQLQNDGVRRNLSDDPYHNVLPSFGLEVNPVPYNFQPKEIVPKQHKSLLAGVASMEHSIEFICFGNKQVLLWGQDLDNFVDQKRILEYDKVIYCKDITREVLRRLCLSEYSFEPLRIRLETFTLEAETTALPARRPIDTQKIELLYECKKVWLNRVERKRAGTDRLAQCRREKKEEEVLEVLSPDEQDIVESIDRSKTVASLKEQIASNYYQIIGEMILISYSEFKLLPNSLKIAQLPEKTIEIYQKQVSFIDPAFIKQPIPDLDNQTQAYQILPQPVPNPDMSPLLLTESALQGQLTLAIQDNELVERYTGGLLGYLRGDRVRRLPLITLEGLKVGGTTLKLRFRMKAGEEVCVYTFGEGESLRQLLRHILVITRNYNHHIEVLA